MGHCRPREVAAHPNNRYRSITTTYYKNTTGAILVYDITKKETFKNIVTWMGDLKQYADPDITAIMMGNKSDLNEERQVTTDEAAEFAKKEGLYFMEVSALTNENNCVGRAFDLLIEEIVKKLEKEQQALPSASQTGQSINLNDKGKGEKKGCC